MIPEDLTATELLEGEITDERFASLIRETSAVLLPYERANQSGVLATAFRAGRPVIATAVGSFAEYVEDGVNGLLIQPGDPGALAGAIERLRGDVGLAETLARGALNTWTLELSSERSAARILAALAR
jgi:glycosyltransferase involved in cell wall biosynthesis